MTLRPRRDPSRSIMGHLYCWPAEGGSDLLSFLGGGGIPFACVFKDCCFWRCWTSNIPSRQNSANKMIHNVDFGVYYQISGATEVNHVGNFPFCSSNLHCIPTPGSGWDVLVNLLNTGGVSSVQLWYLKSVWVNKVCESINFI